MNAATETSPAEPAPAEPPSVEPAASRFAFFAGLAAIANLVHLWNHWAVFTAVGEGGLRLTVTLGAVIASVLVLWRPREARLVVVMAVAQVAHVLVTMPQVADHWLLMAFLYVALLISAARTGRRTGGLDPGAIYADFAPSGRLIVLVCYGAAAVAKHNTAFIDPATSCAVFLHGRLAEYVSLGPSAGELRWIFSAGTVAAETVIPILLVFRSTRRVGVTLGCLFHLMLGFTPGVQVFDFTAVLFAGFYLFCPVGVGARASAVADALWRRYTGVALRPVWRRLAPAALVVLGVLVAAGPWVLGGFELFSRVVLFDAFGFLGCTLGLYALWTVRPVHEPLVQWRGIAHGVLWAVVVFNAACPYIGLKTESSFTMFSNLRTAGPRRTTSTCRSSTSSTTSRSSSRSSRRRIPTSTRWRATRSACRSSRWRGSSSASRTWR